MVQRWIYTLQLYEPTTPIIMTHEMRFRLILDIKIVWSYILFTILIINTKLVHCRIVYDKNQIFQQRFCKMEKHLGDPN